jgi:hypothetical protein
MMQRLRVRLHRATSVSDPALRIAQALHDFEMGKGGCLAWGAERQRHVAAYLPEAYRILRNILRTTP